MSIDDMKVFDILNAFEKRQLVFGSNQVKQGLSNESIKFVVISLDGATQRVADLVKRCNEAGVKWASVSSGKELGAFVGIDVACLCVGVLK